MKSKRLNKISSLLDFRYLITFLSILLIVYFGNLAYITLIDPRGMVYSSFLDQHFNYINWLRNSYLYTSNFIAHLFGLDTHITFPYSLTAATGRHVEMVYECLGINFFSFWTAFVWANNQRISFKIAWWLSGLLCIWFINCVRVAVLLVAIVNHWQYNRYMDHHTLFNLFAYTLIAGLVIMYTKQHQKSHRLTAS
ncbi:MAG: exosortase/archaeosortase family protein [Chitinophagaceae bacterium]|nr:exosortase/archaeosortase family protein [Chitinophagaceae bacterium]